jgi:signal transduction histidine kinase
MGSISQVNSMFYDHYLLVPEFLRKEIEHVISNDIRLKGIRSGYFNSAQDFRNPEILFNIIRELKCDNDILLLCDNECSEISIPDEYSGSVKIKRVESIYVLFAERRILQSHEVGNNFVIVPGWLEKWQYNLNSADMYKKDSDASFSHLYDSILILDTGIHPDFLAKAEEFSQFTGVPFNVLDVGMEHFKLAFDNLVIQWNIELKQNQLKVCNRKAASYAMSIDFIKTIADLTDESIAVESICKLFSTMFAPKNVIYYSFYEDRMELKHCKLSGTDQKAIMKLKDSGANYLVFDTEDGFAIKISTTENLLGIIEIHDVAFPEYLNEYLSAGYDLAKAAGLGISNIRRNHEIFKSREEQVKLTEMLRTTNRILRHDIANNLQVVTGALDLLEENKDEKYISMIRKAAIKSISLIQNVQEIDYFSIGDVELELLNVKNLLDDVINRYSIKFNVNGNCIVMGDKALFSVFDNIVGNAISHGNASMIDISIMSHNGKCEISIADNGTGIPDEVKPRVFDEGYKYGNTGHTGFGLYIAKRTVERCNGSIRVEDNYPAGAKFIIELAVAQVNDHIL